MTPERATSALPSVRMDPATTVRRLVPVSNLAPAVTPTDDVYVIAHMGIAHVDVRSWRLVIDGLVEEPLVFDYHEVTSLPARDVVAVLECFGNPVEPDVPTRRVGNVAWRGVPLAEVLTRARVKADARSVWLEAPDFGTFAGVTSDHYVKDLPLEHALRHDVLLAWAMNGAPLSIEHGFPLRAFVPGFFGTNAVKWLSRIHVSDHRPESLFTTRLYNRRHTVNGRVVSEPVRDLDVQAVIVTPADGAQLVCGSSEVSGWAWSARAVSRVEVTADGGTTWRDATLDPRGPTPTWQRFATQWTFERSGRYELGSRATDCDGRTQPPAGRNRIHTITVAVT